MSRNLAARIAVAAVAIPIILWICYRGGGWLFGMLLLFAVIGSVEFLMNEKIRPGSVFFWLALATVISTYWLSSGFATPTDGGLDKLGLFAGPTVPILLFFVVTAMASGIGSRPPEELFTRHSRMLGGVLYLSLLYPFVYRVGEGFGVVKGGDCLLFLFGLLWVGDTAAMGVGKWFGKHRLAPTVSPNKTVEGFIGGLVGAVVIGVIMHFWRLSGVGLVTLIVCALGCSLFGQLGDLVESMWKRSLGIKDSSPIIPGHGGVLDRFDSLLFAAPFMYFYLSALLA